MAIGIDYGTARELLESRFSVVETNVLNKCVPTAEKSVALASDTLFSSRTQAYREVLLGCAIARILDKSINIRQPYSDQGPNAFSGRTLDEKVVNPFLHDKRIPSSKGPYLSVFRLSDLTRGKRLATIYKILFPNMSTLLSMTCRRLLECLVEPGPKIRLELTLRQKVY